MNHCIKITLAPFGFELLLCVGGLLGKELQAFAGESAGVYLEDDAIEFIGDKLSTARTVSLGHRYIILLKKWDKSNADIGILAHEIHHLLNFIMLDINQSREDNEWEAYFVQDTMIKILYELDICLQRLAQVK